MGDTTSTHCIILEIPLRHKILVGNLSQKAFMFFFYLPTFSTYNDRFCDEIKIMQLGGFGHLNLTLPLFLSKIFGILDASCGYVLDYLLFVHQLISALMIFCDIFCCC